MTTDHVFLSRSSENPSPYEKKELYLTCWLKYKVWKTTNLAFLFPPNSYWRNFAWIFLGFCVHTEILIDCQDENKKKEDEKEPYNSGWQWQSWNKKKRSTYYDISASSTKKKVPELKFERKKRDRIKKKVILQKSRNIILHPLPKFVGLSIVKKKM